MVCQQVLYKFFQPKYLHELGGLFTSNDSLVFVMHYSNLSHGEASGRIKGNNVIPENSFLLSIEFPRARFPGRTSFVSSKSHGDSHTL